LVLKNGAKTSTEGSGTHTPREDTAKILSHRAGKGAES
jgi:hypothetical protein